MTETINTLEDCQFENHRSLGVSKPTTGVTQAVLLSEPNPRPSLSATVGREPQVTNTHKSSTSRAGTTLLLLSDFTFVPSLAMILVAARLNLGSNCCPPDARGGEVAPQLDDNWELWVALVDSMSGFVRQRQVTFCDRSVLWVIKK